METYPRLSVEKNVDRDAQCFYQYVHGEKDIFYPHSHTFFEIFVTVSGVVKHWLNGTVYELPEGSLVFIRPDDVHGYVYDTPQSIRTEYINLAFSEEIAEGLFAYLQPDFSAEQLLKSPLPPAVILNSAAKKRLVLRLNELNTLRWENKKALKLRVKTLLAEVFAENFYQTAQDYEQDMPLWLYRLLRDMEQSEHFTAGSERMVERSGKSREHLARCVKKYTGNTLTGYINDLRVNYAANLLMRSDRKILDICYSCGFQNLGYFYKVFKQKYGCSPAQFASLHKKGAAQQEKPSSRQGSIYMV